jgi:glycosyltransferase involved in cell wall biosynthesis
MKPLVSIIIPVYNVEKYLRYCIESIRRQTYNNYEVIFVDDGSTDRSLSVCQTAAKNDRRFKVFHQVNSGVSKARNLGIKKASGEYITFIDADDYVTVNFLQAFVESAINNDADITVADGDVVFTDTPFSIKRVDAVFDNITPYEYLKGLMLMKYRHSIWGKLFRRSLLKGTGFSEKIAYAEDFELLIRLVLKSEKLAITDAHLYKYLIREGSAMQKKFSLKQFTEVETVDASAKAILRKYPQLKLETDERRLYSYFVVLRWIMYSEDRDKYMKEQLFLDKKIRSAIKKLENKNGLEKSMRIKIFLYKTGGKKLYFLVQRLSDISRQIRLGHKFF